MGRWKLSLSRSSSPSNSITSDVPTEFLCPISRTLMADPVILSTDAAGRSFDRAFIQACVDLAVAPPDLAGDLDLTAASLVLIPNVNLRSAIVSWCDRSGLPPPCPVPPDVAAGIVSRLASDRKYAALGSSAFVCGEIGDKGDAFGAPAITIDRTDEEGGDFLSKSSKQSPVLGKKMVEYGRIDEKDGAFRAPPSSIDRIDEKGDSFFSKSKKSPASSNSLLRTTKKPSSSSFASTASMASSSSSSSSYLSTDIPIDVSPIPETPKPPTFPPKQPEKIDDVEDEIFNKLKDPKVHDQETSTFQLLQLTRDGPDRRLALCTPRILGVLRPLLLSRTAGVQTNATATLVNLSIEPQNKTKIVRSGVVPPLVDVLKSPASHPDAKDNAAGALFSLALDDDHRVAIGVLGALPPLLALFSLPTAALRGRRDAGAALHYLTLAGANRSKLARAPGAVRALLAVASNRGDRSQPQGPSLSRLAMMVVCNLASCGEGRAALRDGGAVAAVVELVRTGGDGADAAGDEERCLLALHAMSRGSLRFRGLARTAGAEEVLERVVESAGAGAGEDGRRDLAARTLRAMRGEDDGDGMVAFRAVR